MPGLAQSLEGQDLGRLKIVAECWGIELKAKDTREALTQVEHALTNTVLVEKNWKALPADAQRALTELAAGGGRLPWPQFSRLFGELREMGAARRDKERPDIHPVSTTEILWYRALIGRAFFDSPQGPLEFAYVPDDLLSLLPIPSTAKTDAYGRPSRPEERANASAASDHILDEACTLLAALRMGLSDEQIAVADSWRMPPAALQALLQAAGIVNANGQPNPEATRAFLKAGRNEALAILVRAWLQSKAFNELRMIPELITEGKWENDPLRARQKVLAFASSAPAGQWWSISSILADAKMRNPDFQRPAGDFDSWYVRDAGSGEYLRGFAHWERVDGALIAYLLRGPMHWLGLVDLAGPDVGQPAVAFRWSGWAKDLLAEKPPKGPHAENEKLKVDSQGKVLIPRLAPRTIRYQVARFCRWLPAKGDVYPYQITAHSLEAARKQRLQVRQLVALLKSNSPTALPPNLLQALKRWEQHGSQARLSAVLVLRVQSAAALKALRASRAARYLGEPLGPTSITVKAGAAQSVLLALTELGYLGEFEGDEQ